MRVFEAHVGSPGNLVCLGAAWHGLLQSAVATMKEGLPAAQWVHCGCKQLCTQSMWYQDASALAAHLLRVQT